MTTLFQQKQSVLVKKLATTQVLSADIQQNILQKLECKMAKEKLYLDQNLTMYQLAIELKTNTSYLSQIIRRTFRSNFATYLNSMRIEEFKRFIADKNYDTYSIDFIAKKCGYKNRSTFYLAFKNITGTTPNNYRYEIRKRFNWDKVE